MSSHVYTPAHRATTPRWRRLARAVLPWAGGLAIGLTVGGLGAYAVWTVTA